VRLHEEIAMEITILSERGTTRPSSARRDGDALWLNPAHVDAATGWTIKPEGLCRGPVCVPAPVRGRGKFLRDDAVNVAAFWRRMDAPLAVSAAGDVWAFGERAEARAAALESLQAPDFALPGLDGRRHTLSEHRGDKVLLTTWASW
jgi:hypothetical protein